MQTRWIAAVVTVLATAIAAPAAAQVVIHPEALPDLERVLLTAPDLDDGFTPGLQRARIVAADTTDSADVDARVGASLGGSTRATVTAAAGGTREAGPTYGALAMDGMLGIDVIKGLGVDLALAGALERSTHDFRPSPMPMRPAGSHLRRALDGEAWFVFGRGDGGWAVMPLALGIDDIELGALGDDLGTGAIDRQRTRHVGAAIGYRAYDDRIPDATIAVHVDGTRTDVTTDTGRSTVEHVAVTLRAEGLATSASALPVPLIGVPGTGLGFTLELGRAWLHDTTTDEHGKIWIGTFGVVAAGTLGGIGGVAVSVAPSHTPDGGKLARLWRLEARYDRCMARVCADATAALAWIDPLHGPSTASIAEHQATARLTYAVHPFIRVGFDYRLTHHGAADAGYDHAVGLVLELGGYTGPVHAAQRARQP